MLLDLTKILDQPETSVRFETELDLSDLDFGSCRPVAEPLEASGEVRNEAGVLHLTGSMHTVLHCICDRCCTPFLREFSHPLQAILTPELADVTHEDEDLFELDGDCADLDDIINTQFVLNMDSRLLCREDCAGLCPRCGANLNDGPCGCTKELDPRLAVLAQLLQDKDPQDAAEPDETV